MSPRGGTARSGCERPAGCTTTATWRTRRAAGLGCWWASCSAAARTTSRWCAAAKPLPGWIVPWSGRPAPRSTGNRVAGARCDDGELGRVRTAHRSARTRPDRRRETRGRHSGSRMRGRRRRPRIPWRAPGSGRRSRPERTTGPGRSGAVRRPSRPAPPGGRRHAWLVLALGAPGSSCSRGWRCLGPRRSGPGQPAGVARSKRIRAGRGCPAAGWVAPGNTLVHRALGRDRK